ncbi:sulfatase [Sorangium sp. So ce1128]
MISLDTLRADVAYSGRFPTMARLGRESTTFRRTIASAPFTPTSHGTILTGLQPANHGIRHLLREKLNSNAPTLAMLLRAQGYATGAIVSCPGLNRWYGLFRGFSHYDDEIPKLPDGRDPVEVADVKLRGTALKRAPLVVERALGWLAARPREPFFLFVHFFDAHWPYEAPVQMDVPIANPYEGEVAYMDHYLGMLLDGVASLGYALDDAILVALSDHGEDLAGWYSNDHAGGQGHPEEEGHGCLLFDTTQLVPLWLRAPGRLPAGLAINSQVRLVDVVPTLLDMLSLPGPRLDGDSLLPIVRGEELSHRLAYCETFFPEELGAINPQFRHLRPLRGLRVADRYKLIWQVGSEGVEAYDLHEDPDEKRPLRLPGLSPLELML